MIKCSSFAKFVGCKICFSDFSNQFKKLKTYSKLRVLEHDYSSECSLGDREQFLVMYI